ncbi:hypothetical protein FRB99_002671 [Tulasnella sp. 403]|nr:hypothetical protein FRB99_002671 [Tulasnella sp. 403]
MSQVTTVVIDGSTSLELSFLSHGTAGCVYTVVGGFLNPWTGQVEEALAKTRRTDSLRGGEDNERKALDAAGRLFLSGTDADRRSWLVMQRLPGVRIWQHPLFTQKYPKGYNYVPPGATAAQKQAAYKDCTRFLTMLYDKVLDAYHDLVVHSGWDPVDVNWDDYLFTLNEKPEDTTVNVVDLGLAEQVLEDRQDYWNSNRDFLFTRLRDYSALAFHDTPSGYQGTCHSEARQTGSFVPPETFNPNNHAMAF